MTKLTKDRLSGGLIGIESLRTPGKIMQMQCHHPNLVVHTLTAVKQAWEKDSSIIDWDSNVISAHYLCVLKYYCPTCRKIIPAPKEAPNA